MAFSFLAVGLQSEKVPLISILWNTRSPRNTLVYKVEEDESGTSKAENKPAVQCRYEMRPLDEEGGGRTTYNHMRAKKQDFARVELFLDKVDLKASLDDDGEDGEGGCGEKSKEDHVQACDLLNVSFLKNLHFYYSEGCGSLGRRGESLHHRLLLSFKHKFPPYGLFPGSVAQPNSQGPGREVGRCQLLQVGGAGNKLALFSHKIKVLQYGYILYSFSALSRPFRLHPPSGRVRAFAPQIFLLLLLLFGSQFSPKLLSGRIPLLSRQNIF